MNAIKTRVGIYLSNDICGEQNENVMILSIKR